VATILESRAWSAPWLKSKPESESGKMVGERMVQRSLKVAMASSGMRVKRKLESFQGSDEDDAALSEGSRHCRDLEEDNSYPAQMDWEERSCPGSVGPSNELDALDEDMVDHAQPKAAEEGFAECDDQARSDDEASSRGNPADNNDEDLPPREDSGAHQIPDDEIVRNDKDFWRAVINIGPTTIRCPLRVDREDAVQDWLELRDVRVGGDIKEAQRVQRTLFLKRKTGRRSSRG